MASVRNHIVQSAMEMFYRHGTQRVSIEKISRHTGVTRKSVRRHFDSKEALLLAAIELRDNNFISWFQAQIDAAEQGKDAIINIFLGLDAWFKNKVEVLGEFRGCFFINTIIENKDPNSAIFQACYKHKETIKALIKEQVMVFQHDEMRAEQIADILCVLKEGCITSAQIQQDRDAALKALPTVKSLLQDGL